MRRLAGEYARHRKRMGHGQSGGLLATTATVAWGYLVLRAFWQGPEDRETTALLAAGPDVGASLVRLAGLRQ
jgi:hypothetical protein